MKQQDKRERILQKNAQRMHEACLQEVQAQRQAVFRYVNSLPLEEQVAQLFIVNLVGSDSFIPVEWTDASRVHALVPGGYIFFSYNIADTPEKIIDFTDSIYAYCEAHGIIPPYLALDQEGGDVCRLRTVAARLPSCEQVAATHSVARAHTLYSLQAMQMKQLGFTMNLAPVAEVRTDSNSAFLDGRSFGAPEAVVAYGTAAVNAFQNAGVGAVLKHFPGNTNTDPHTGLPEISISVEELLITVMQPFSRLINCNPAATLMSHARISLLDHDTPACLSYAWVTEKLRGELSFDGLIISDDIFMAALAENGHPPETACVQALESGVDVIMISEKRFAAPHAVLVGKARHNSVFAQRIAESCRRVINFKIAYGILSLEKRDGAWNVAAPERHTVSSRTRAAAKRERLSAFENARQANEALYE
ncbi:MAG: glycoside hydrolase family 3 protein [Treponema sp.]|nr:glycoside hydrolase family 3 protein [Treponema sp.]